jgi:hypothetical protein
MSEHKRKEAIRKAVDEVTRRFNAEGRLVEAGFAAFLVLHSIPADASEVTMLRDAFMGGAQHLFGSITGSLMDEDAEPTEADLDRMAKIDAELDQFTRDYARRHGFPPPPPRRPQ